MNDELRAPVPCHYLAHITTPTSNIQICLARLCHIIQNSLNAINAFPIFK